MWAGEGGEGIWRPPRAGLRLVNEKAAVKCRIRDLEAVTARGNRRRGTEESGKKRGKGEDGKMKIAMPYDEGRVNPHFGTSREFAIYTMENGKIAGRKIVSSQDLAHNHEGLAGLLKREGVETVITGGIGNHMLQALYSLGFKVVTGASGEAAVVAVDYAAGDLVTANINICSCGHEQH